MDQRFEVIKFNGQTVLFTPERRRYIKDEIPKDLYVYEMRHSDEGFEACQLAKGILVNFYGTIISSEEIKLDDDLYLDFEEEEAIEYTNELMTLKEYQTLDIKNGIAFKNY